MASLAPHLDQSSAPPHTRLAAVLGRRWPTGAGILATGAATVVVTLLPDGVALSVSAWCVLLAAAVYLVWGVVREQLGPVAGSRGRRLLAAQTVALFAFAAAAVAALSVDGDFGRYLLAAAWLSHAGWDVVHHRLDAVVPRWYAELCLVCDLLVAAYLLLTATVA